MHRLVWADLKAMSLNVDYFFFKGLINREYRITVRLQQLFENAKRQRQDADYIRTGWKRFKMMTASHSADSIKYEVIIEFSFQKNVSSCDVLFLLILLTDRWHFFFFFWLCRCCPPLYCFCSTSRITAPTPFLFYFLSHWNTQSINLLANRWTAE